MHCYNVHSPAQQGSGTTPSCHAAFETPEANYHGRRQMRCNSWPTRMLGLAAISAVIAGCGSSAGVGGGAATSGASSAPTDNFTKVTLGTVSNLMHVEEFVAAQEGFYAENGLDVKVKVFASGSDITKALQAGTIEFGTASTTSVPSARAAGVLLKSLTGGMNDATSATYDGPLGIVGRKDRGITDQPSSLKGKRIGTLTGSTTTQYLDLFLAKNGMTADDVTIVNLQVPDHPVSLKQGDVDAVASWEPYVSQEIRELGSNAVTVSRGEGLLGYVMGLGALDSTLKNKRDVVLKFVAAMAQGDAFIRKNPEKAAQDAAAYLSGLDVKEATTAIKDHLKWDPRISACTQAAMLKESNRMFESEKIKTAVPLVDLIDASLIGQVEKEHPEWFADLPPIPPGSCTK